MVFVMWIFVIILICIVSFIYNPLRRPLPTESDYSHHLSPLWELYYCSKYLKTIKRAEKGSGLEDYFRNIEVQSDPCPALEKSSVISIKAVGDLMCRRDLMPPASRHLWDEVGAYVFDADFTMANLEFVVNPSRINKKNIRFSISPGYAESLLGDSRLGRPHPRIAEKFIHYSVPPGYAESLLGDDRFGRFHLVSIANNHINDSLSQGIISTCDYLDTRGIPYVGASRTEKEVDKIPIVERRGIKIAVLSYTFSTNNIPLEENFNHGVNVIRFNALNDEDYDPSMICRHIELVRKRGADIIIASNHWGIEFEYYPSTRLVKRAHDLLDAGIDIIIGHHPHTLNPAEWYITKDGRRTLCLYSLGNITSNALIRPLQKMSIIAEMTVQTGVDEKGERIVRLKDATLMPTYFLIKGKGKRANHRIIPVISCADSIRTGNTPEYMSGLDATIVTLIDKDFRKHLWQEHAFTYK